MSWSKAIVRLLAINCVAAAVMYARWTSSTASGSKFHLEAQAWISRGVDQLRKPVDPSQLPVCGLLKWKTYTLISQRVVLPDGVRPAAVHVVNGKIASISEDLQTALTSPKALNFKTAVIMPGVIDVHTHLNEPGREDWEGISTGTAAAIAGGITTIVDMPLNSFPVTTTVHELKAKWDLHKKKAHTNVRFWAGLVPENAADHVTLRALVTAGAAGFKCFMTPSGIADFENVAGKDIAAALPFLKAAGVPLYVHAELVSEVEVQGDPTQYATYMNSRPPKFEQDAIRLLIELLDADETIAAPGFSLHIAHLSDAGCLPLIKAARERHPITVETVAAYLMFNSGQVEAGQTWFKCAPPIRGSANQEALIQAVLTEQIDLVGSDHSPAPPDMKHLDTGDFLKAWGGINGLQYLLPATWSALHAYGVGLPMLSQLLSTRPAKLAGLGLRKGKLAEGFDADITVWEPEELADTSVEFNEHRHKISPFTNTTMKGKVIATIVQGQFVNLFGKLSPLPCGGPVTA